MLRARAGKPPWDTLLFLFSLAISEAFMGPRVHSGAWPGHGLSRGFSLPQHGRVGGEGFGIQMQGDSTRSEQNCGTGAPNVLRARRRVLFSSGCAAGGLLLPVSARSAEYGQEVVKMLDSAALSRQRSFSRNELDTATVSALSQEEEFKEEAMDTDAIFTFRGEQLMKTNPNGAVSYMSRRNAVFFGESHDSVRDKLLATRILMQLKRKRKVALGLEMVQQPFQPVLDWYVFQATPSKSADTTLFRETEWETRWGWDFESYLFILKYAQLHKVRMLALNVEAELTSRVRTQGLPSLSRAERSRLIMDPEGFRDDTIAPSFGAYVDAVLRPSFDAHLAMGMFQNADNAFSNFVSNRILWDETMATTASRFLLKNPEYLLCGLVGGDHVKTVCVSFLSVT